MHDSLQLKRTETQSSISTNATAPNLPGPGRTMGLLFDKLGAHVETFVNSWASQLGYGPKAIAQEIRRQLRHNELSIRQRYTGHVYHFTNREEKRLKSRCKRLLHYARHRIPKTQIQALEEIFSLAIDDPLARTILSQNKIDYYLSPTFREDRLFLATRSALCSFGDEGVHSLWSGVLLGRLSERSLHMGLVFAIRDNGFDSFDVWGHFHDLINGASEQRRNPDVPDGHISFAISDDIHEHLGAADDKANRFLKATEEHGIYSYIRLLKKSLKNPDYSFLAARYLKTLGDIYIHPIKKRGSNIADIVIWLCDCYLNDAPSLPHERVEWVNLLKLLPIIPVQKHRSIMLRTAPHICREVKDEEAWGLLRFFSLQELSPFKNGSGGLFLHKYFISACLRALQILFRLKKQQSHLLYFISHIRRMDNHRRSLLKESVLGNEALIAYFHLMDGTYDLIHKPQWWPCCRSTKPERNCLSFTGSDILTSCLDSTPCGENELLEQLVAICWRIHRYCKNDLVRAALKMENGRRVLDLISSYAEKYATEVTRVLEGDDPLSMTGFFLLRFELDKKLSASAKSLFGTIFVRRGTSELYFPDVGSFENKAQSRLTGEEVTVNEIRALRMFIPSNAVMFMKIEDDEPLDVTGHYPVLAGYDHRGEPLYIASKSTDVDLCDESDDDIFTYVKNGDSHATFRTSYAEDGKETFNTFYVLVLRHNPVDWSPRIDGISIPENAVYPTGPLFWQSTRYTIEGTVASRVPDTEGNVDTNQCRVEATVHASDKSCIIITGSDSDATALHAHQEHDFIGEESALKEIHRLKEENKVLQLENEALRAKFLELEQKEGGADPYP